VADLSFISLRLVLPALADCTAPDGDLVPMVKPQFEVGKDRIGPGGGVRDPRLRAEAGSAGAGGAFGLGVGTAGGLARPPPRPGRNVEFFLWLRRTAGPPDMVAIRSIVAIDRIGAVEGEGP